MATMMKTGQMFCQQTLPLRVPASFSVCEFLNHCFQYTKCYLGMHTLESGAPWISIWKSAAGKSWVTPVKTNIKGKTNVWKGKKLLWNGINSAEASVFTDRNASKEILLYYWLIAFRMLLHGSTAKLYCLEDEFSSGHEQKITKI